MKKFLFFLTFALLFAEISLGQINAPRGSKRQIINQENEIELAALKAFYLKLAGSSPALDVSKNPTKAELWAAITNVAEPPIDKLKFNAGYMTETVGDYTAAFNFRSYASGENSFAAGSTTTATGYAATAMGLGATASGNAGAFAVGQSPVAAGDASAAFGKQSRAGGNYSFVVGSYNKAEGAASFAGGMSSDTENRNEATGKGTFMFQSVEGGVGNKYAAADYSAVLGGRNNSISSTAQRSVVLGGFNQSATLQDAVYVHQLKLKPLGELPTGLTAADAGLIVFDDFVKAFRGWNGTAWVNFH